MGFASPQEMFHDWQHEAGVLRDKERDHYLYEMDNYKHEAIFQVSKDILHKCVSDIFAKSLAIAYNDGDRNAQFLFKKYGLNDLHLLALLDEEEMFIEELDRYNSL